MKNALSEKWTGAEFHRWVWRLFSKSLYNKAKAPWCSSVAHTYKNPLFLSKNHIPWAPTSVWKEHTPSRRWTLERTWSSQLCRTDYSTSQQPVRNKKVFFWRGCSDPELLCVYCHSATNNAQLLQSLPISCRQQQAWQVLVPVYVNTCAGADS